MAPITLRIGISQGHGGATVIEGARALAEALRELTLHPTRLHVADDYAALKEALRVGTIEVGWLPPFVHIATTRAGAALVAVCERDGALTYRSAIIVRADSPIRRVEDLNAARVAWTDPSSASGYVFPRLHLLASGVDPAQVFAGETFYGSPRAVCAAIAEGQADVGACFTSEAHAGDLAQTLVDVARIFPAATWRLRVLSVTEAIPSDGMVVAARVPADVRDRIAGALLRLHSCAPGAEALQKLFFAEKLVAVNDKVVRAMERLAPRLSS